MKSRFDDQDDLYKMRLAPDNYKWGIFYYNPRDSRLFVPKRIPILGFTVNFANPFSYLILIILLALVLYLTRIGIPNSQFPKIG
jgi:uncharacterized membrane protein